MNLSDVKEKLNRKNQILFLRDSQCLRELRCQISMQKHRTLVLWAFACVQEPVRLLKSRHPDENRPEAAVAMCKAWAAGKIKMPTAKKALLAAHAAAKNFTDPADIALCHAVGQACTVVHVETHAIGLPIYELTALVREYGIDHCEQAITDKISRYISNLHNCVQQADSPSGEWADFFWDDSRPNKEWLLLKKQEENIWPYLS